MIVNDKNKKRYEIETDLQVEEVKELLDILRGEEDD